MSSAVAAPALAGIPVTHRGLASSFAVITGHHEATYGPLLDGFPPGALTLVVLMGAAASARAIAERLLARGWSPATPAARDRRARRPRRAGAGRGRSATLGARRDPGRRRRARPGCW